MTASATSNRVKVACPCGKKYRCRRDVLGKMFRCRACGDSIRAVESNSMHREASSQSACPECGEELMPDTSFCLLCGHDLETGQNLLPQLDVAPREPARSVAGRRKKGRPKRKAQRQNSGIGSDASASASDAEDVSPSQSWLPLVWLMAGASALVGVSYLLQAGMGGRWFLVFYGAVLAGCWGFSEWNRDRNDAWFPFGVAIATYLAVGVGRFFNHGMENFALIFMMFAGTTLIAVGVDSVSGEETTRDVKVYVYLPGISIALSLVCLLWTVIGPGTILVLLLLYSMIFGRHHGYGGGDGGGGCGGGCGGGDGGDGG